MVIQETFSKSTIKEEGFNLFLIFILSYFSFATLMFAALGQYRFLPRPTTLTWWPSVPAIIWLKKNMIQVSFQKINTFHTVNLEYSNVKE